MGVIYRRAVDPHPAQPSPPDAVRPNVVRPLSRAAARTCARPGCPSPASATLRFRYEARLIHLDDLAGEREPESYDLCVGHTERTAPPHGWSLEDRRTQPDDAAVGPIGGEGTVALLAQMLGRDREAPVTGDAAITSDAAITPEGRVADGAPLPHEGPVDDEVVVHEEASVPRDSAVTHGALAGDAAPPGQPRLFDDEPPRAEVRATAW